MPSIRRLVSCLAALTIVTAAKYQTTERDCDINGEGFIVDDELLVPPKDELQSLGLLQMEVTHLRKSESGASVATHSAGVSSRPNTHVFHRQGDSFDNLVASNERVFRAIFAIVSNKELPFARALSFMQEGSVHGSERTRGHIIWIVVLLIPAICLLAFLASPMLFPKTRKGPAGVRLGEERVGGTLPGQPARGGILSQGPPGAQQLLQAPGSPGRGPPAICQTLILPHTEARFMIPIESLMRASGELDIRGTSGRKLLHGTVTETPEGRRCISIASCGCEEDPRVVVLAPARTSAQGPLSGAAGLQPEGSMGTMEIYAQGGRFYGTLESRFGGGAVLRHRTVPLDGPDGEGAEQLVMSLEAGAGDLRMTASSMDGRLLASAGKDVQLGQGRMQDHDTWKVQVKPGQDAVLIVACMLSALLFGQ